MNTYCPKCDAGIEERQNNRAKICADCKRKEQVLRQNIGLNENQIEAVIYHVTEKTSEQERAITSIRRNEIPAMQQRIQEISEEQAKEKRETNIKQREMQEEIHKMKLQLSCLKKQVEKSENEKDKSKNEMETMKLRLQLEQLKMGHERLQMTHKEKMKESELMILRTTRDNEQGRKEYFDGLLQKNISPEVAVQVVQSIGGTNFYDREEEQSTIGVEELNREEEDRVDCPLLTENLPTQWTRQVRHIHTSPKFM